MGLINDAIGILLDLAPVAALVALVLAGLALRNQGSFFQGGKFAQWVFWAIVMLTLPQLLSWFSGFGVSVPISGGGGTAVLNAVQTSVTNFVNWVGNVIAPVGAGAAVLGGIGSYATGRGYMRWLGTAVGLLAVSGLTRLLEFWIQNGTGGVS